MLGLSDPYMWEPYGNKSIYFLHLLFFKITMCQLNKHLSGYTECDMNQFSSIAICKEVKCKNTPHAQLDKLVYRRRSMSFHNFYQFIGCWRYVSEQSQRDSVIIVLAYIFTTANECDLIVYEQESQTTCRYIEFSCFFFLISDNFSSLSRFWGIRCNRSIIRWIFLCLILYFCLQNTQTISM